MQQVMHGSHNYDVCAPSNPAYHAWQEESSARDPSESIDASRTTRPHVIRRKNCSYSTSFSAFGLRLSECGLVESTGCWGRIFSFLSMRRDYLYEGSFVILVSLRSSSMAYFVPEYEKKKTGFTPRVL